MIFQCESRGSPTTSPHSVASISETEIVKKMLQVVPDHLEQVSISIEKFLDVNDLTVEEVTGRLRNVEQREKKYHFH